MSNVPAIVARLVELNTDHHRRMKADHDSRAHTAAVAVSGGDSASRGAVTAAMTGAAARFGLHTDAGHLLELGAGYAGDRAYLMDHFLASYTGVEVVPHVALASKDLGVLNMALEEAPDEWTGRFDWVYSRHVMEHMPDVDVALDTIKRVLAPNGVIGAVTPHYFPDPEPAHVTQLTLAQWCTAYRRHGLIPVYAVEAHYACKEAHVVAVHRGALEDRLATSSQPAEQAVLRNLLKA